MKEIIPIKSKTFVINANKNLVLRKMIKIHLNYTVK